MCATPCYITSNKPTTPPAPVSPFLAEHERWLGPYLDYD